MARGNAGRTRLSGGSQAKDDDGLFNIWLTRQPTRLAAEAKAILLGRANADPTG
jgi:hypothetical protein